jgi:hypothetical protein
MAIGGGVAACFAAGGAAEIGFSFGDMAVTRVAAADGDGFVCEPAAAAFVATGAGACAFVTGGGGGGAPAPFSASSSEGAGC